MNAQIIGLGVHDLVEVRFVITIIATGTAHAGVTAWKSSGADLRAYEGQG